MIRIFDRGLKYRQNPMSLKDAFQIVAERVRQRTLRVGKAAVGNPSVRLLLRERPGHLAQADGAVVIARRNALGLRGWLVLHTTWWRHRDDPIGLVGEVRHALARRT